MDPARPNLKSAWIDVLEDIENPNIFRKFVSRIMDKFDAQKLNDTKEFCDNEWKRVRYEIEDLYHHIESNKKRKKTNDTGTFGVMIFQYEIFFFLRFVRYNENLEFYSKFFPF